ncbi:MAG: hypothetical protein F4065_06085 [Rhodothermaceae bacterium]|nr:hypothetical protein [Rhodothermaceae bacterium]MXZ58669.1 hypothetical protein [Rhodothermaceae bacterium]MYH12823.1 hypothetical protein [Rhodothermaceae bacterium]MYJ49963.1 hypothetical protein [Rhodothermaceae bacterium]
MTEPIPGYRSFGEIGKEVHVVAELRAPGGINISIIGDHKGMLIIAHGRGITKYGFPQDDLTDITLTGRSEMVRQKSLS